MRFYLQEKNYEQMLHYLKNTIITFENLVIHLFFTLTPHKKHNNFLLDGKTIDFIIENKCSVCRYGDGEFDMIFEYLSKGKTNSLFQKYDAQLAKKLYENLLLPPSSNNILICLPIYAYGIRTNTLVHAAKYFWEYYYLTHRKIIYSFIKENVLYGDAHFTRFYWEHKNKESCTNVINKIKNIWKNRSIVFVEGEYTRSGIGNDLFENAISIQRIIAPATNAFRKYEKILQVIKSSVEKNNLIIISLGQTATVLAYDLSLLGYQALDLGHLDVEYEWYRMKSKDKSPLKNKYVNENKDGHINTILDDPIYLSQIIAYVK